MADLIKYGLIAAGVYVAYEMFMKPGTTVAAIPSTAPSTGSVPPVVTAPPAVSSTTNHIATTTAAPPSVATTSAVVAPQYPTLPAQFQTPLAKSLAQSSYATGYNPTVAQLLIQANGGSDSASADQWNYWYSQLSGVQQTADLFADPNNRAAPMRVSSYLGARATAGLSGLGGYDWSRAASRPMHANPYRGLWT